MRFIFLGFFYVLSTSKIIAQTTQMGTLNVCGHSTRNDTIFIKLKITSLVDSCFFFNVESNDVCYLLLQADLRSKDKGETGFYFPCPGLLQLDRVTIDKSNAIRLKRNESRVMQLRFAKAGFIGLPPHWEECEMRIKINYADLDDNRVTRENLSTDWFSIKKVKK